MSASRSRHWIEPRPEGIFVTPAQCWVDPAIPVPLALVTHGHGDHARGGHGKVVATAETLAIMALRYATGERDGETVIAGYGETIAIGGGVTASFHPAGHILGSAQILLEHAGERVLVTGDFKRRADPTCAGFVPVACDILITEATFGLPVFIHPPIAEEIAKLLSASAENPDRAILVGAYALGKAQRLIAELRCAGYHAPIFLHGALIKMCALYEEHGVALGALVAVAEASKAELKGAIVLAPPSALNDRWSRRLPDPLPAMASGWMRVRQRARQRGVELPLVISDHADWAELTSTIAELSPQEIWVTHGREEGLVHWCETRQLKARALALVDRDEDEDQG